MLFNTMKKGFTLAEVLVTLVVIGIIAALSIPALLQNTNQAELKTAFKKSSSTLNQALVMSVAQDATDASSCCAGSSDSVADQTALARFFAAKLNVISQGGSLGTLPDFTTADGMTYTVTKKSTICPNTSSGSVAAAGCVMIVDVNGGKSPNNLSTGSGASSLFRDRYELIVRGNSVIPAMNGTDDVAMQALQN